MQSATHHYDTHLGAVYSWMVGDQQAAERRAVAELERMGIAPAQAVAGTHPDRASRTAVDLGAGFGLHALPLARLGYSVTAIDSCSVLLDELKHRADGLSIVPVLGDVRDFRKSATGSVDLILCMGDTLTHLPNRSDVERLFDDIASTLATGGSFGASFRDYASAPLSEDRRFIPVRSDENRILTCFLEYGDETVTVHDVLHERAGGQWEMKVSSYPKLRLSPDWVVSMLSRHGLAVRKDTTLSGMVLISATRP